jgi:hypothetical protein
VVHAKTDYGKARRPLLSSTYFNHECQALQHQTTDVLTWVGGRPAHGRTRWCTKDRLICLEWEWSEVAERVYAIADPAAIACSVRLTDDEGTLLDSSRSMIAIVQAVTCIAWQTTIANQCDCRSA